jgi:hypothetical protein
MFMKYAGQLGKAEAEWVRECIDRYGSEEAARKAVQTLLRMAVEKLEEQGKVRKANRGLWHRLLRREDLPVPTLAIEEQKVLACTLASPDWWRIGLAHLAA